MNVDTFAEFIHHLARLKPQGKCLLIFDGAKCHLNTKICDAAEENDVTSSCTACLQTLRTSYCRLTKVSFEVLKFFGTITQCCILTLTKR